MDYRSRYGEAQAYLAGLKEKGKMDCEYMVLDPKEGEPNGLSRCVEGMEVVRTGGNLGKT